MQLGAEVTKICPPGDIFSNIGFSAIVVATAPGAPPSIRNNSALRGSELLLTTVLSEAWCRKQRPKSWYKRLLKLSLAVSGGGLGVGL